MIRTLVVGAALGIIGKKLYDEGKLEPYIAEAKTKLKQAASDHGFDLSRNGSTDAVTPAKPATASTISVPH